MNWAPLFSFVIFAAKRVMVALGIGFVSYQGLALLANQVRDMVLSELNGLTGAAYQVVALAGGFEAVGILLGGIMARVSLVAVGKFIRIGMDSAHE